MKALFDYLFNFIIESYQSYFIKSGTVLFITFSILYIVYYLSLRIFKRKGNLFVESKLLFLYSICFVVVLYNIYWFFVIRINGESIFKWYAFPFDRTNAYLMISPILIGYIILVILFLNTKKQIKKIL